MRRTPWLVLLTCVVLLGGGLADAQVLPPKWTKNPELWRELVALRQKAAWILKAWDNPTGEFEAQLEKVKAWQDSGSPQDEDLLPEAIKYLGVEDFELQQSAKAGEGMLRRLLAKALVAQAEMDPIFDAVIRIAEGETENRFTAAQAAQLLLDAMKAAGNRFPPAVEAARDIFMKRLADGRNDVVFKAIEGLGALPTGNGSSQVAAELIKLIKHKDQGLVAEAARALGEIGAVEAVRPLMEAFLAIKEDSDPVVVEESSPAPPLNLARMAIAQAVGKITKREINLAGLFSRGDILKEYDKLVEWWNLNKDSYQ